MEAFLICDDYFLAQGLLSMLPSLRWLQGEESVNFNDRCHCRRVFFIDDRLSVFTVFRHFYATDRAIILLRCSERGGAQFPLYPSIDMSLSISALMQRVSQSLSAARHHALRHSARFLTPKEDGILSLLVSGLSIPEVALKTGLSPKSIYGYRNSAVRKFGFYSYSHFFHALSSSDWDRLTLHDILS